MWKVFILNPDGSKKLVYNNRWMPTTDDMEVVSAVRGKKYLVLTPAGKNVTASFRYGEET